MDFLNYSYYFQHLLFLFTSQAGAFYSNYASHVNIFIAGTIYYRMYLAYLTWAMIDEQNSYLNLCLYSVQVQAIDLIQICWLFRLFDVYHVSLQFFMRLLNIF